MSCLIVSTLVGQARLELLAGTKLKVLALHASQSLQRIQRHALTLEAGLLVGLLCAKHLAADLGQQAEAL